jgi:FKBP-type peptidyl-prolyl cis-trans isomerase FkpA
LQFEYLLSDTISLMRKWVKFGGVTVGAGLVVGFGVVALLYLHRNDAGVDASVKTGLLSSGGNLSTANTGPAIPLNGSSSSSSNSGLQVVTNGDQGQVSADQTGGSTGSNAGGATPTPNTLPGPSGFSTYDQFKDHTTALYIDTQPGTGAAVAQGSVVTVEYAGWLTDGTEFDAATVQKPFTYTEGSSDVIPGFQDAIFGMKVGGERRLIIPPSVGYGPQGKGPIPANAVLVFDVILLSVK